MDWIKLEVPKDIPLDKDLLCLVKGTPFGHYEVLNFSFDTEFECIVAPSYESYVGADEVVKYVIITT